MTSLFDDEGFRRNHFIAIRERNPNEFAVALYNALIENAKANNKTNKTRKKGGDESGRIKKEKADNDKTEIHRYATDYLSNGKQKRDISNLIMMRTGFTRKKVLDALHTHPSGNWLPKIK